MKSESGRRPPLRIAVVEDDPCQMDLICLTLEESPGIEIRGTYRRGKEALLGLAHAQGVDIALIDLNLPDIDGLDLVQALVERGCRQSLVILTANPRVEVALHALRIGALGYVLKDDLSSLVTVLHAVGTGAIVVPPSIAPRVRESLDSLEREVRTPEDDWSELTVREQEILLLLSRGCTYDSIGEMLGIRLGTVQTHVKRLYRKLDVTSKAEAAAEAIRRGLG